MARNARVSSSKVYEVIGANRKGKFVYSRMTIDITVHCGTARVLWFYAGAKKSKDPAETSTRSIGSKSLAAISRSRDITFPHVDFRSTACSEDSISILSDRCYILRSFGQISSNLFLLNRSREHWGGYVALLSMSRTRNAS